MVMVGTSRKDFSRISSLIIQCIVHKKEKWITRRKANGGLIDDGILEWLKHYNKVMTLCGSWLMESIITSVKQEKDIKIIILLTH